MSYEEIINICCFLLSVLLAIVNCLTRGRYKKILSEVQKVINYRQADYRTNVDGIDSGTEFSNLIPQYRLNKASGVLEEAPPLDIQKLVNSSRNVELKQLLQRLEQGNAELTQQVNTQYNDYSDDLDELGNALDIAEEYRERFGMGVDVSVSDIFARIEAERDKLKQSLDILGNQTTEKNQDSEVNEEVKNFAEKNEPSQE